MNAERYTLRIFHLSDLHARGPRETEGWRRRRVLGAEWRDNLTAIAADGRIDIVCFTGDIADWGKAAEYTEASDFVDDLLANLGATRAQLFVVPGNHDVDRGGRPTQRRTNRLRAKLLGLDEQLRSRLIAGTASSKDSGISQSELDAVLARTEAYRRWISLELGRPELLPGKHHPRLGFRTTADVGLPFPVHIVGLDSAWLANDDHDQGKLLLTEDQIMRLTTDGGEPLRGFRLGLIHHPISHLIDADSAHRLLRGNVDLLLRGHAHLEELVDAVDPHGRLRTIAAGAIYEGVRADNWPNSCQVITVSLSREGSVLEYEARFRGWSARGGYWHDDNSLYRATRNGRIIWTAVPRIPERSPELEAIVGRDAELNKLGARIKTEGPGKRIALYGMPGVGKSLLERQTV